MDPPYRDRALWTAIGALSVVIFIAAGYVDSLFGNNPTTWEGVIVEAAIWGPAFLVLLGWIVTSTNVAISADYFNRDVLRWKKGGWVVVIAVTVVGYVFASLPSWWFPQWFTTSGFGFDFVTVLFFAAIGYATLVLILTYFRIRDLRIRRTQNGSP